MRPKKKKIVDVHIRKEPRLVSLCMNAGVPEEMMDVLGNAGVTSVALLKNSIVDAQDWRDTLKQAPLNLNGTDFATRLEIGKLVSVYEACTATNDVELKANAERIRQNLLPEVQVQEIIL